MANSASSELSKRAQRAASIGGTSAVAEGPLRFAAALLSAQSRVAAALESRRLTGDLQQDAALLIEPARALLASIADCAPAPLAEAARERRAEAAEAFAARLRIYWLGDLGSRDDYLSRAILRPYCAALAAAAAPPVRPRAKESCPFCGGWPSVCARRPEADATRRLLCCALCGGEWPVNRIRCPACGEEDPARLPSFQAETHPFARIEACDTCRRYVKSIDLSQDGRLVPEVDDLASMSLDLWAAGQGYQRLEPGLAGL